MGLCAIHEVGFYTDHDDALGCGLHSNCFGVFRMMHFADDAFLMRIHMVSQKKGTFLIAGDGNGTPRILSIALGIYILEQRIPLLR